MTADAQDRLAAVLEIAAERLVILDSGCFEWTGSRTPDGYGVLRLDGRQQRAHRVVYEASVGVVPDGLVLDHLCRNRACVNPDHLEPVTPRINTLRGEGPTAINAAKDRCDSGHEFTPDNTIIDGRGWRQCRSCVRATDQSYKDRIRQLVTCAQCGERLTNLNMARHNRRKHSKQAAS